VRLPVAGCRLPDADDAVDRLCLLVMVGVRPDGAKELGAVTDGHREDTQSWLDLLRDLRDRGMTAPEVAVGDGALGFWAALPQVFGTTRVQRCWVHKVALSGRAVHAAEQRRQGCAPNHYTARPAPPRSTPHSGSRPTSPPTPRRSPRSPTTSTCC
jgi:hypothetical protein